MPHSMPSISVNSIGSSLIGRLTTKNGGPSAIA
jgi:hypothetical protein